MQLHRGLDTVDRIIHPRLAEIAADLAISAAQTAAWEVFVETFDVIARALEAVDVEVAEHFADRAPSLPNALTVQVCALSARLRATRMLKGITDSLYRSLTPRQRERANRLLPAVCGELVWPSRLAR